VNLSTLLDGVTVTKLFQTVFGKMVTTHDVEIDTIRIDSRRVGRGDMFVAVPGMDADGHAFASDAMQKGAKAIVLERDDAVSDPECMHAGVVKIVVPDARQALARMAANYYGRPAENMKMVGITGTNGKTTTAQLIGSILKAGGERTGTIGTVGIQFGTTAEASSHTTPDALELHHLLARMGRENISAVSMEVSSHALVQSRIDGIAFACGVFTNLTQDHLDYHGTMEDYIDAKKILFDSLSSSASAVVNADDPWCGNITKDTKAHIVSYGTAADASVRLLSADVSVDGSTLEIQYEGSSVSITTPLIGLFNVSNVLAGFAAGVALGVPIPAIELGIASLTQVKGRFERVRSRHGWTAIIDYAHTPDALEKCLQTVRQLRTDESTGRILTVFGAGGSRDKGKRPQMGGIVARLSDVVIVTSDNPRSEDPDRIIDDIMGGIDNPSGVTRESDRKKAIALAASMARKDDIILIAGKGHEDVQVIGDRTTHFSDREEIEVHA
jgi:UDP-N-acetylmuramoyl-L-alanyl-D-glutamate--2,6-diaminopimelate ligase